MMPTKVRSLELNGETFTSHGGEGMVVKAI